MECCASEHIQMKCFYNGQIICQQVQTVTSVTISDLTQRQHYIDPLDLFTECCLDFICLHVVCRIFLIVKIEGKDCFLFYFRMFLC